LQKVQTVRDGKLSGIDPTYEDLYIGHSSNTIVFKQTKPGSEYDAFSADSSIYDFMQHNDYSGNDISGKDPYSGSLSVLEAWCTADSECIGFNTAGYAKNALSSEVDSDWQDTAECSGFYMKKGYVISLN
jgi:hypothetical protein